jgi:hypothetical protein
MVSLAVSNPLMSLFKLGLGESRLEVGIKRDALPTSAMLPISGIAYCGQVR